MFQQMMLNYLKERLNGLEYKYPELGTLTFNLGSLHIYKRHWALMFRYFDMSDYDGERWELNTNAIYDDAFVEKYGYKPTDTVSDMERKKDLFIRDNIKGAIL